MATVLPLAVEAEGLHLSPDLWTSQNTQSWRSSRKGQMADPRFARFPGRFSCILRLAAHPRDLQRPWAGPSLLGGSPRPPRSLPSSAHGSETLFPEGALYSGFIFRGSANKFLPNCPQTKKVHISAVKVTGGIADQAWHICRPPPTLPTICSHGHRPPQLRKPSIHLSLFSPDTFPPSRPVPGSPPPPSLSWATLLGREPAACPMALAAGSGPWPSRSCLEQQEKPSA